MSIIFIFWRFGILIDIYTNFCLVDDYGMISDWRARLRQGERVGYYLDSTTIPKIFQKILVWAVPCFSPTATLCLGFGAEPTLAASRVNFRVVIVGTAWEVVDLTAIIADVAFNGAVVGWCAA